MFAKFPMDVIGYISKYHFKICPGEIEKDKSDSASNSSDEESKSSSSSLK